ncbi:hypothetical protein MMC15_002418 [Xylographa vitiligo]|nr:hypothetical protein [Xylographa vitiligo]
MQATKTLFVQFVGKVKRIDIVDPTWIGVLDSALEEAKAKSEIFAIMLSTSTLAFLGLLSLFSPAAAQTWTSCNPMNSTTCPSDPALGTAATFNFTTQTSTDASVWNATAGTVKYNTEGAFFTINQKGDSPTIQSNFYIFFGTVEVIMKAASGQGVISSIVLESDDLDEIDWELMGGNTTHAETNYFGKGNTTSYDRATYYPVNEPQENFHNYTVVWTQEKIEWLIDGDIVRTLLYADALGGKDFPQTPMNVRLGIWAGGDSSEPNGTIEWAGGLTDYSKAPFEMVVSSIRVMDASKGASYTYGDKTGSYKSIKIESGNSTIAQTVNAPPAMSPVQKFQSLSKGAQIGIIAGAGAAAIILLGLLICCCVKQRRAGRRERALVDADYEKRTAELMAYRSEMSKQRGYVQVSSFGASRERF